MVIIKNKKGFTTVELLITIAIFTVIYFIGVYNVSHAFSYSPQEEEYKAKIHLIEKQAVEYAKQDKTFFDKKNTVYLYVEDLVQANYLSSDKEGDVIDPRNSTKSLNNLKIKLIKEKKSIKASIVQL